MDLLRTVGLLMALCLALRLAECSSDTDALLAWKSTWTKVPGVIASGTFAWERKPGAPCNFWGVACDSSSQRVTALVLVSLDLQATIAPQLGQLSELELLALMYLPGLSGSLPPELGQLERLTNLQIVNTTLSGPLPNLQGMKSLSNLTVQYSSLNGSLLPASALPRRVRSIVLSGNQLSGAIPASYRRLRRLVGLDVGSNRLGGPLPSLTALPLSLTALNLRDNLFTGPLPGAWAQQQPERRFPLSVISLDHNPGLTGRVPEAWAEPDSQFVVNKRIIRIFATPGTGLCGKVPQALWGVFRDARFFRPARKNLGRCPARSLKSVLEEAQK